jgi:hypothetical protein
MCPMERADRMPRSLGTLREHDNLRSLTDAGDGFEHCIALIAQTSLLEDVHEQARVTKRSGRCDGGGISRRCKSNSRAGPCQRRERAGTRDDHRWCRRLADLVRKQVWR